MMVQFIISLNIKCYNLDKKININKFVFIVLIFIWYQKNDLVYIELGKVSISIKDVYYNIELIVKIKVLFKDY